MSEPYKNAIPNGEVSSAPGAEKDSHFKKLPMVISVLSLVATVIGVFVAFYIFRAQRSEKRLSYSIIASGPLVNVTDNLNGRLKLAFDNKPVPNVNLVILRLSNSGNEPIQPNDFSTPITFTFGKTNDTQILDSSVSTTYPPDVTYQLKKLDRKVVLSPGLLNSGDSITLKVLLAGGDYSISSSGRISGVKSLERVDTLRPSGLNTVISIPTTYIVILLDSICAVTAAVCINGIFEVKRERDRMVKVRAIIQSYNLSKEKYRDLSKPKNQ